ncbi:MAG: hypothetical protein IKS25_02655, partial [Oscillospiraceae bacterium]|nr:hypothetical protein [Oscillospiraceae bacterium]
MEVVFREPGWAAEGRFQRRRMKKGEALSFGAPSPFRKIMSAHAGGMCVSQCAHLANTLISFPDLPQGKRNAN